MRANATLRGSRKQNRLGRRRGREGVAKAIALNSISKSIAITTMNDATDLAESFIETFLMNKEG